MELSTKPICILIVHNSTTDTRQLKNFFLNTSIDIKGIFFKPGLASAIAFLKNHPVDIIFLDLVLPARAGIKIFESLQLHNRQIPIVVLTGMHNTRLALEAINKGAQDFLTKDDMDERMLTKTILYSIERKRIAESLLLSDERYKLVSKATNDMVWDWDLQRNRVFRNKSAWDRLFGDENDDSNLPDSWWERVHPADRKKTNAKIDHILNNKDVDKFEIECRVIKNDGTFAYVIDRGYAIRNEAGEAIRLVGVTQNVTSQKEAEEKLKASERRFRSIIEKSNEGLMLLTGNGVLMDISASGKKIIGHTGADIDAAMIAGQLASAEDRINARASFADVLKKYGRVKVCECRLNKPDGSCIWIEAIYHNMLNEPAIQAVIVHFRDISSRKAFEQELQISEEKYRNLFNANPSSIIISGPEDFSIIEINDAAVKEFGYSRKEFLKLKTTDLVEKSERARIRKTSMQMQKVKDFQEASVWPVITNKGLVKYMDSSSRPINYYGKKAVLTIANNISEKIALEKKLEEERLKKQREITTAVITAQEQERELLGKELHDNINQILVTTKLYIEYAMTNEEMKTSLLKSAKDFIASAVSELRNMAKSLLPPSLGEVGLIMAIDELVESIQTVNKFKLYTDWRDLDEALLSDQLKLTIFRIIQEQLSNIIKHAAAKKVWIKIKIKNMRLIINIKDDGVGFSINEKNKGVGFKNITSRAELYNGIMKIASEKEKGCTLNLRFNL